MFGMEYLAKAKQDEYERKAEYYRLVSEMHPVSINVSGAFCRILLGLGSQMSNWGDQIQERYGESEVAIPS
jgi:hypothetical protein